MGNNTKETPKKPVYIRAATHARVVQKAADEGLVLWIWVDRAITEKLDEAEDAKSKQ